jgi:ABC-2 type transport system ATP-binding protein
VSESAAAVETAQLQKRYGDRDVLRGVDLSVREGELFGFLGANGAGKTTTIRILCGLLRDFDGEARVAGFDVREDPLAVKARIGILPEEPVLYERLSYREMLWYAGRLHSVPRRDIEQRSDDLLRLVALEDDADRPILDGSMGMRKKIGLACALIHKPRVLFLDEPFNGIDTVTSLAIQDVLVRATERGLTVFFTSHVMEVAERLCHRFAILKDGLVAASGTLADVRRQVGADDSMPLAEVFAQAVAPGATERGRDVLRWL